MQSQKVFKALALTFASVLTVGLTSCGHTHTIEHIDAKNPTCTEGGNIEYWHCTDCDKYFSDDEFKNEIEKSSLSLAALGHNFTHVEKVDPTCTEAGNVEYWHCDRCNLNYADEAGKTKLDSVEVKATGHSLKHVEAKEATCTENGNSEYWTCTTCGKFFSDSEAKKEIKLDSTIIAALGHKMTHHEAKAATCTEAGNVEYWHCDRCNLNYADEAGKTKLDSVEVKATGHDYVEHYDSAALEYTKVCKNDESHKVHVAYAGTSKDYPVLISSFAEFDRLNKLSYGKELLPADRYEKNSTVFLKFMNDIEIPKNEYFPSNIKGLTKVVDLHINADVDLNGKKISFVRFEDKSTKPACTPAVFNISKGAKVTVHGNGTIDTMMVYNDIDSNGAYCFNIEDKESVLTIKDGTYFGSPTCAQVNQGTLNVEGGYYRLGEESEKAAPQTAIYEINCIKANFENKTAVINVTGGIFRNFNFLDNKEAKETSTYLNPLYTIKENKKEGYTDYEVVLKSEPVKEVTSTITFDGLGESTDEITQDKLTAGIKVEGTIVVQKASDLIKVFGHNKGQEIKLGNSSKGGSFKLTFAEDAKIVKVEVVFSTWKANEGPLVINDVDFGSTLGKEDYKTVAKELKEQTNVLTIGTTSKRAMIRSIKVYLG